MKIFGIVGEICAGKTTIAKKIANCSELRGIFNNILYIEGDEEIRKIYKHNIDVIEKIRFLYPSCIVDNKVDTKLLGEFFFASKKNQKLIESITHSILREQIFDSISKNRRDNVLLILDVPVLFKLKLDQFCDHIAFFTATQNERIERGIKRMSIKHAMTDDEAKNRFLKIDQILAAKDKLQASITIDTTNCQNDQDVTIKLSVNKIVNFLKKQYFYD